MFHSLGTLVELLSRRGAAGAPSCPCSAAALGSKSATVGLGPAGSVMLPAVLGRFRHP